MKRLLVFSIILNSFFLIQGFAHAQNLPDPSSMGTLNAASSPEFPGPNSQVRISLSSFSTDLNRATIGWYSNGKLIKQAVGMVTFDFKTGAIGSKTEISAVVKKQEGGTLTKNLTFQPAEIDLLWASNTVVPPLYKGRALKSSEAQTKVTAVTNFVQGSKRVPNSGLVFEWALNSQPLLKQSGPGKNSLEFRGATVFGRDIVELTVSTIDKNIISKRVGIAPVVEPEIVFYHEAELAGTEFHKALSVNSESTIPEFIIRAVPYYVSREEYENGQMKLNWVVNGKALPDQREEGRDLLALQNESGGRSKAVVNVSISNPTRMLQEAVGSISLVLNGGAGSSSGSNFFNN
ncbi:MAG TPA: hypothetical protein VJJ24_03260 [Candidatus Paceibacterota bacterium]